jgi:GT2 family glycosyltransferase
MRIGAVILHYNRIDLTLACCESLLRQSFRAHRVLVVDNGSSAHAPEALSARLASLGSGRVETLRLEANRGFAGGNNAGVRRLLDDPAIEAVLLLNNDTVCPPELLERLAAALVPGVGLVGCEMVDARRASPAHHASLRKTGDGVLAAGKNLSRVFAMPVPAPPGTEPDYLQGSCLLVPREALEKVGLLDERYTFFFEDADYSLRMRKAGYRLAVADGVRLLHYGSATIGAQGRQQAAWYRESTVIFLRRWRNHPWRRAFPPFLFRLAADLLQGRFSAMRGSLEGWRKGWNTPAP